MVDFPHAMFDYRRVMLFNPKGSSVFGGLGLAMVCFTWAGWRLKPHVVLSKKIPHIPNTIGMDFMKNLIAKLKMQIVFHNSFLGTRGMGGEARVPHQSLKGGEWPRLCRGQREAFSRLDVDHFGLAPTRSNQDLIVKKFWSERNRKRRTSKNHSFGGYRMMLPRCYINHAPVPFRFYWYIGVPKKLAGRLDCCGGKPFCIRVSGGIGEDLVVDNVVKTMYLWLGW